MGDTQPKPIYSYIVFDPASRRITQVKEKVKISDHANTYVLRMDSILVRARSDQVPNEQCKALLHLVLLLVAAPHRQLAATSGVRGGGFDVAAQQQSPPSAQHIIAAACLSLLHLR